MTSLLNISLTRAAKFGYINTLKELITKDNIDILDKSGYTVLLICSWNDHLECVHYLLTQNANVNIANKDGWTAVHNAVWVNNFEMIKLLVDAGSAIDIPNNDGRTPLFFSIRQNHSEIAKYLIQKGAKLENVKLKKDDYVTIPQWIKDYVQGCYNCREVIYYIIFASKSNDGNMFRLLGKDIINLILKDYIWNDRYNKCWIRRKK